MTPTEWFHKMREIWLQKEPALIATLIAHEVRYYESPLSPPLTSVSEIINAWKEIEEQEIELLEIIILHEDHNIALAQWRFRQANQADLVGCYFLKLDEQGKCTEFRQWWHGQEVHT